MKAKRKLEELVEAATKSFERGGVVDGYVDAAISRPRSATRRERRQGVPDEEPEPLWDTRQAARALGLAEKTVRQYVWLRQIPFLRINRAIRFRPSQIRQLLAEAEVPARERR